MSKMNEDQNYNMLLYYKHLSDGLVSSGSDKSFKRKVIMNVMNLINSGLRNEFI